MAGSAELDDSSSAPAGAATLDALPQRTLEVQPLGAVFLHHLGVGDGTFEVGLEAQLLGVKARRQAECANRRRGTGHEVAHLGLDAFARVVDADAQAVRQAQGHPRGADHTGTDDGDVAKRLLFSSVHRAAHLAR